MKVHGDLDTSWEVSGPLHTPVALSPVSIGKEAGWAPELVWMTWRKFLTLLGLEL
jgi:hypothetical protein